MSTMEDLLPFSDGLTITPIHLYVLALAMFSILISPSSLPPDIRPYLGVFRRAMVLLVLGIAVYSIITVQLKRWVTPANAGWSKEDEYKLDHLLKQIEVGEIPSEWNEPSAHPSRFLTTPHGRPRLFPFPLGKAGGKAALKGELWWEAGNAAHVGHFNQSNTPEERAKVEEDMKERERKRVETAKKAKKAYEDSRAKWNKRLSNIKLIGVIVVIGLFYRKVAAVALAGVIYYTLAVELQAMLKPKEKEKKEPPLRRSKRKVQEPWMALAYLYEPASGTASAAGADGKGGLREHAAIPVQAGMSKLISSTDRRYAS